MDIPNHYKLTLSLNDPHIQDILNQHPNKDFSTIVSETAIALSNMFNAGSLPTGIHVYIHHDLDLAVFGQMSNDEITILRHQFSNLLS